jgi:hypothetical protein
LTAPQSRLPERNLTACTRIETDAVPPHRLSLYSQQNDLVPPGYAWQPAPAYSLSRTPRFGSFARRADGAGPQWSRQESLALYVFCSPGAGDPSRVERPYPAGPRGNFERHQTGASANQQKRLTGPSAASHHKVASGRSETTCAPRKRSSA